MTNNFSGNALLDDVIFETISNPTRGLDKGMYSRCVILQKRYNLLKRGLREFYSKCKKDRVFKVFEQQGLMQPYVVPGTSNRYNRGGRKESEVQYSKEGWGWFFKTLEAGMKQEYEPIEGWEGFFDTHGARAEEQVKILIQKLLDFAIKVYKDELAVCAGKPRFRQPEFDGTWNQRSKAEWRRRMEVCLLRIAEEVISKIEERKAERQSQPLPASAGDTKHGHDYSGNGGTAHALEVGRPVGDAPVNGAVTTTFDPTIVPYALIQFDLGVEPPVAKTVARNALKENLEAQMAVQIKEAEKALKKAGMSLEQRNIHFRVVNDIHGVFKRKGYQMTLFPSPWFTAVAKSLKLPLGQPALVALEDEMQEEAQPPSPPQPPSTRHRPSAPEHPSLSWAVLRVDGQQWTTLIRLDSQDEARQAVDAAINQIRQQANGQAAVAVPTLRIVHDPKLVCGQEGDKGDLEDMPHFEYEAIDIASSPDDVALNAAF